LIVPIHPRLQGGAFSAPAGKKHIPKDPNKSKARNGAEKKEANALLSGKDLFLIAHLSLIYNFNNYSWSKSFIISILYHNKVDLSNSFWCCVLACHP
jgi:hypothetical protein